jgi:ATP synthase in type III secretion protein N
MSELMPRLHAAIRQCRTRTLRGRIERISGTVIDARIRGVRVGELCRLRDPNGTLIEAEVVGITEGRAFLTPIGDVSGLSSQTEVEPSHNRLSVGVGAALRGCVLDGLGRVLDHLGERPAIETVIPIDGVPPAPLERPRIARPFSVGTRAIDGLMTCAEGQRTGIFGGPGSGKSRLVARITRHAVADVFVIALVGERGREVREFLDHALGPEGRRRAVTVVATSDRPALERVKAAQVATAIAEWFRDRGQRVVLLIDSLTRLARAWREIGLAAGEPPARRGFPPSVFAALPRLLERAASTETGTITAFYTVLVEGELADDPIAEEVKAILDGHLILSSTLAESGYYPAIDVLASTSRVMDQVVDRRHRDAAIHIRRLLSRHRDIELLVRINEYQPGSDPLADEALQKIDAIQGFLRETADEATAISETLQRLSELAG